MALTVDLNSWISAADTTSTAKNLLREWVYRPTTTTTPTLTDYNIATACMDDIHFELRTIRIKIPSGDFTLRFAPGSQYKIDSKMDGSGCWAELTIEADGADITRQVKTYEEEMTLEEFLGFCESGKGDDETR